MVVGLGDTLFFLEVDTQIRSKCQNIDKKVCLEVNLGVGDIYRCTHLFTIFKEKNIKLLKNRFQNEKNQVVKKIVF